MFLLMGLGSTALATMLLFHLSPLLAIAPIALAASGSSIIEPDSLSDHILGLPGHIAQNLGPYSPYYPAAKYHHPPHGCEITQVNILQRHGARSPTSGASKRINATLTKLRSVDFSSLTDPKYEFLETYSYTLGTDDLVPFGALESYQAGVQTYKRYSHLLHRPQSSRIKDGPTLVRQISRRDRTRARAPEPESRASQPRFRSSSQLRNPLFVRSAGDDRVVDSAKAWISGVERASRNHLQLDAEDFLVIPEASEYNNTIANNNCPAAHDLDTDAPASRWADIFTTPILRRLSTRLPGIELNSLDVTNLMSLCAFETVAKQIPSEFCDLFEKHEWESYEYFLDLGKYYGNGYGNKRLGPVQGVGYVNELLARLTSSPVSDYTNSNRTSDSSSLTFPLHLSLYADFSHDNLMASVFSALGLFNNRHHSSSSPSENNNVRYPARDLSAEEHTKSEWKWSEMAPFSGRLVVEKLSCPVMGKAKGARRWDGVRILVDDRVKTVGGACRGEKICELGRFVQSQGYAREGAKEDWKACFAR